MVFVKIDARGARISYSHSSKNDIVLVKIDARGARISYSVASQKGHGFCQN